MKTISKSFLTGLAAVLPVTLTLYLLYWLAYSAESLLGRMFRLILPSKWYLPGLGLAAGVLLVLVVGMLMQALVIQKLFTWTEKIFVRVPIFKTIYGSIRDFIGYISRDHTADQQQVVLVKLGEKDMKLIGFATRSDLSALSGAIDEKAQIAVYLPMSYQIGGYTVIVPKSNVQPLNMSFEDAMRFVLTAGIANSHTRAEKQAGTDPS